MNLRKDIIPVSDGRNERAEALMFGAGHDEVLSGISVFFLVGLLASACEFYKGYDDCEGYGENDYFGHTCNKSTI